MICVSEYFLSHHVSRHLVFLVRSLDNTLSSVFYIVAKLTDDAGKAAFLWRAWGLPVLMGIRILLAIIAEVHIIRLTRNLKLLDKLSALENQGLNRIEKWQLSKLLPLFYVFCWLRSPLLIGLKLLLPIVMIIWFPGMPNGIMQPLER